MREQIRELLKHVTKPYRYVGGEDGAIKHEFTPDKITCCLMFPDMYEVAISNLGHRILYHVINKEENIICDRTYAPAHDFLDLLEKNNLPLYATDSFKPINEFDVVAISLSYELSYPTALRLLDVGQINIKSQDRNEGEPIIVAGGSCCYNPEPMSEFIDIFTIGDGETTLKELLNLIQELKKQGFNRSEIIEKIGKRDIQKEKYTKLLESCYVPKFPSNHVKKSNNILSMDDFPVKFPVPLSPSVHDRVIVELRRGCGRMCRFCQACFVNLPIREREATETMKLVDDSLQNTGYEEYSLLSLSSNDYNGIEPLLSCLAERYAQKGISVSLPSQRADKFSLKLAQIVNSVRKGTITIAIEAGTQRLRDCVNKNLNEEQIFSSILSAYQAGWDSVKLYLMIGLPTETYEDLDETIELLKRIKWRANNLRKELNIKKLLSITATVSIFVPKAFTPFQWCGQNSIEEIKNKISYMKEKIKTVKGVRLNFHSSFLSQIEAVFSRGDMALSKLIFQTYKNGSYLDAWHESFNQKLWENSADETGISLNDYATREFAIEEKLPWDFITTGVEKEFLKKEYLASKESSFHKACDETCVKCGACSFSDVKKTINKTILPMKENVLTYNYSKENENRESYKYRLKITKTGVLKYISHLDFLSLIDKSVKKAGLDVAYTLGFNPTPKIALAMALPLFIESEGEIVDIELYSDIEALELQEKLQKHLHENCTILKTIKLDAHAKSAEAEIEYAKYIATYYSKKDLKKNDIECIIKSVLNRKEIFAEKTNKKGITKKIDIAKAIIDVYSYRESDLLKVEFTLRSKNKFLESADKGRTGELDIPALRADSFIELISPKEEWDIKRVELLNESKKSLL